MAKSKNESNNKSSGTLLTEKDGTQYFVMGKVRIKAGSYTHLDVYKRQLHPYPLPLFMVII